MLCWMRTRSACRVCGVGTPERRTRFGRDRRPCWRRAKDTFYDEGTYEREIAVSGLGESRRTGKLLDYIRQRWAQSGTEGHGNRAVLSAYPPSL